MICYFVKIVRKQAFIHFSAITLEDYLLIFTNILNVHIFRHGKSVFRISSYNSHTYNGWKKINLQRFYCNLNIIPLISTSVIVLLLCCLLYYCFVVSFENRKHESWSYTLFFPQNILHISFWPPSWSLPQLEHRTQSF